MAAMYHPLIKQIERKYYQCMNLERINVCNDPVQLNKHRKWHNIHVLLFHILLLYQGSTVYPQIKSKNGYLDGRTIKNKLRSDMTNVPLFFSPLPQSEVST